MAQDTGHAILGIDEIKNVRTDGRLDDGTALVITDGETYEVFNTGSSEVSLTERAVARGAPSLDSDDAVLIPPKRSASLKAVTGFNYYVWSLNASSRVAISEQ